MAKKDATTKKGREVPRPFNFHWGGGQIIEEAAYTGKYTEPSIQSLGVRRASGGPRDQVLLLQPRWALANADVTWTNRNVRTHADRPVNDRTRLSKTLAHVLRHDPGAWGLKLDEGGWVALADVVAALDGRFRGLSIADLRRLVRTQSKRRYEIEGTRIRALYGHSVPVSMGADPVVPPDVLYHGTTAGSARRITSEGLRRMGRQRVHLSADVATALDVGRRRTSNPIILVVRAAEAHQSGIRFWRPSEGVWLSDDLPASFISVRQS